MTCVCVVMIGLSIPFQLIVDRKATIAPSLLTLDITAFKSLQELTVWHAVLVLITTNPAHINKSPCPLC